MNNSIAVTADSPLAAWLNRRLELRSRKRAKLNLPALLCPFEPRYRHLRDVGKVRNFTREGLYFTTRGKHYFAGMRLVITFPFCRQAPALRDFLGKVKRIETLDGGTLGIAVRLIF